MYADSTSEFIPYQGYQVLLIPGELAILQQRGLLKSLAHPHSLHHHKLAQPIKFIKVFLPVNS